MKKHILLENAKSFSLDNTPTTFDATYDKINGFWVDNETAGAWINEPKRPRPTTKKCDIETGEDKK